MKWQQPLVVLFVMGLVASTLGLGPWGGFIYLLYGLKLVLLVAEFVLVVTPLWLLRRQVQRDVVDLSGAVQAGMNGWFAGYVVLWVAICWLPWFRPSFVPVVPSSQGWVQYIVAAGISLAIGLVAFVLKRALHQRSKAQ